MKNIKYIDILLPYKETFEFKKASAVSLTIFNSLKHSKFKKKIRIFGKKIHKPMVENYFSLKTNRFFDFGNNISIAKRYLKFSNNEKSLVEIHNRPKLFNYIVKRSENPISIHFHNDPTKMNGSITVKEREFICANAHNVYFVSTFIKKKFLSGISKNYNNLHVLFNGIDRSLKKKPLKKNIILFVGRLVNVKGINIFTNSLKNLLDKFPEWESYIVGTVKPGYDFDKVPFYLQSKTDREGQKIINKINDLSSKIENFHYLDFLDNKNVQNLMKKTSILVVPSIWDDPCPLTPIEGLANSAVVVSTNRGGIPEIIGKRGIIIKNINHKRLTRTLTKLITDKKLLKKYINLSWSTYNLDLKKFVKKQDILRSEIMKKF